MRVVPNVGTLEATSNATVPRFVNAGIRALAECRNTDSGIITNFQKALAQITLDVEPRGL